MSRLPTVQPNAEGLRILAELLTEMLPSETLFALIVVKKLDNGLCNYISNANRNDVARLLRKAADQVQNNLN